MSIADLELNIAPLAQGWGVSLRLLPADIRHGPFLVELDLARLQALDLDAADYGSALSDALFAVPAARAAFNECRATALGAGQLLRVRLFIAANLREQSGLLSDPHALRWERMLDPYSGRPLGLDSELLLSRYLSAKDYTPLPLRPKGRLRALVAVASPSDAGQLNLAHIDVVGETSRAVTALGRIPTTTLGLPGRPLATWEHLRKALEDGCDILYLVAHGAIHDDQPWLFLVDDWGQLARVPGEALADWLRDLRERRPRLVVLASCESAGDGYANTLAALGPLLAQAGVPAVLAMQGKFSIATNERFTPAFFQELERSQGVVDRAVNHARLAVADRPDWWMPVLYSRLPTGELWPSFPPQASTQPVSVATLAGVIALLAIAIAWFVASILPRPLVAMSEGFNVAIAGIAVDRGDGVGLADQQAGRDLSDLLFNELGDNDGIDGLVGWRPYTDGGANDRTTSQGIGFIAGTAAERAVRAAELAEALKADVVIYGLIKLDAARPELSTYYPEIYINPQTKDAALSGQEILGVNQLGAFMQFNSDVERGRVVEEFSARADQLGSFLNGLEYYQSEDFPAAREQFCLALAGAEARGGNPCAILATPEQITLPDEAVAVILVFLGALEARADDGDIARALATLEQAHARWPEYARPFISKGQILFQHLLAALQTAQPRVALRAQMQETPSCFDGATRVPTDVEVLTRQTIACWQAALAAPAQPANVDVQPKVALSLGTLYLLLTSTTADSEPYWREGRSALEAVITAYERGDAEFQQRFRRYAGYAYGRRGLITVYYPSFAVPAEKSIEEYRQAASDYRTALGLLQITEACRADVSTCLKDDQRAITQFLGELCRLEQRLGEGPADSRACVQAES